MALNNVLIALTCVVTFPVAALAQSPAWTMAANGGCCATATDDGNALAASVLLPPGPTLPAEDHATALAASALLPAECCGTLATPAVASDHPMADMPCCSHGTQPGAVMAGDDCCLGMTDDACCTGMKDGCGTPCCQIVRPTR